MFYLFNFFIHCTKVGPLKTIEILGHSHSKDMLIALRSQDL